VDVKFCWNQMLFVGATQIYNNRVVHLICNAILVTKIFCYQYSTINNSAKKSYFSMKYGYRFTNVFEIKCAKILFRFVQI